MSFSAETVHCHFLVLLMCVSVHLLKDKAIFTHPLNFKYLPIFKQDLKNYNRWTI